MPSPSLVPDEAALDLAHLHATTFGDVELQREVLAMFAAQTAVLMPRLCRLPDDAAALAHTLKGSAMAIGAHHVAEAAEAFEGSSADVDALQDLRNAVEAACLAIDRHLQRS